MSQGYSKNIFRSKPTKTKEPAQEKSAKKNVYAEIIKPDSDDEEWYLF